MTNMFGDENYYVLLYVPITINNNREVILTSFNKSQARVAKDILNQPHNNRMQWATKFINFLETQKAAKLLKIDTMFTASLTKNALVMTMPVNLHWRAMRMLALVCLSGQETLIRHLAGVFQNIECGVYENRSTQRPFDFLQGFKK